LYRTGFQVNSGKKDYPAYPSWEELAAAQAEHEIQKRSWTSFFLPIVSDPAFDSGKTEQVEIVEEPAAQPQMEIWPFGTSLFN
jgi:hypothetical protein